MRVAIAGIVHETNTYCRDQTPAEDFHQRRGEQLFRARGTESTVGGALAACDEYGIEVVPLLVAVTQPSGTIEAAAYHAFKDEIQQGIEAAGPLDGIMLDLHGAGVVDGVDDLEGDLAMALRKQVGEAVPIVATFDLHGNVTQDMADALDGVFACHQYPHVDMHLRARECIDLIRRMHNEGMRPVSHVERVPMLVPTTTTFEGIGQATLERMLEAEKEPGVIDVSWFHGFPYTDVPHIGTYVVVTTDGDRSQAERIAREQAAALWNSRDAFRPLSLSADEAVARAGAAAAKPVVINETSDNCGGGAPGDGTHLLRAMMDAKLERACFGFIVDAETARQAHEAGVGADIEIRLGGRYDDLHGEPIVANAYVKALHDGRFILRAMGKGSMTSLGPLARLVIEGIDVVVASKRSQTLDIGPFVSVGIDVAEYDVIGLKSSNHFRAGFRDIAGTIVTADPPGLTTHHIEVFPREKADRALWPIDDAAAYET